MGSLECLERVLAVSASKECDVLDVTCPLSTEVREGVAARRHSLI